MRQCHCSHKGMGVGIHYSVIHCHVCKKFFQALSLMSNVRHLVVLLGNLLLHLDCLSILECCLDPGHSTSVNVQIVCLLVGVCVLCLFLDDSGSPSIVEQ